MAYALAYLYEVVDCDDAKGTQFEYIDRGPKETAKSVWKALSQPS